MDHTQGLSPEYWWSVVEQVDLLSHSHVLTEALQSAS